MHFSGILSLFDLVLWLGVFVLHALEFPGATLSHFELERRAREGDEEAIKLLERERLLPRLRTLRRIIEAVMLVLATTLAIAGFGWLLGVLIASVLGLLTGTIAKQRLVERLADWIYVPREYALLDVVRGWSWLDWLAEALHQQSDARAASKEELSHIVERSVAILTRDELLHVKASLELDAIAVSDVMTPASVLDTVAMGEGLGPLVLDGLHKTGHSRFPVIGQDLNHVVGILYLHDIINLKSSKASVREAMDSRVYYIHEQQSLEHALHGFLKTHHHLFVVVNEYRETVGVLTLEDVLEKLLGKKIVDEFDRFDDLRAVAESNPRKNNSPSRRTDI